MNKYILLLTAIAATATACHRNIVPSTTPIINSEIKNDNGQNILAGHCSLSALQINPYKEWYDKSYSTYIIDSVTTTALQPLLQNKTIEIFLGSWCGDSKREVPHMFKVLQQAGFDTSNVRMIFVNNSMAKYKQSPQHEEQGKNIHHVPTFIVYDGKKELGRIVESPVVSLEKDLVAIISKQQYQPNFKAVTYWQENAKKRSKAMRDTALQQLVSSIKPLCKSTGELNAYGYMLLAQSNYTEALNVFKMNTYLYPTSAAVFDSLGEAYATTGNKEEAIKNYKRVLELKPGDANATKMLEKLN